MKKTTDKKFKYWMHGAVRSPAEKELTMHALQRYIAEFDTMTVTRKTNSSIEFENNWYNALAKKRKRRDLNSVSAGKIGVRDDGDGNTQVLFMFSFDRTRFVFAILGIVLALMYLLFYLFYSGDQLLYLLLQLWVFPLLYLIYYSIRFSAVRAFKHFIMTIEQTPSNGR